MIIYKYLDKKGTVKTLKNKSVLLNQPANFNDPFDSLFRIKEEDIDKAFDLFVNFQTFKRAYKDLIVKKKKASYLGLTIKHNLVLDANIIRKSCSFNKLPYLNIAYKIALKILRKEDADLKKEFNKLIKSLLQIIRNTVVISCFGSNNDSVLMWSYYAEKHQGACIEFEVDDDNFKTVSYQSDLPTFDLVKTLKILFGHEFAGKDIDTNDEKYSFIIAPILTKSIIWRHEGEIRCIYPKNSKDSNVFKVRNGNQELMLLKIEKIKRIYLGCNADDDFVSKIKKFSKDIPLYKMVLSEDKYELLPSKL